MLMKLETTYLVVVRDIESASSFRDAWNGLRASEPRFAPDFDDVLNSLANAKQFVLIAEMEGSSTRSLACFVEATLPCNFSVGRRHFGSVSTKQLYLIGETVLGKFPYETWLRVLKELEKIATFDFINLGEIVVDSDLYRAVAASPSRYRVSSWSSADNVRWLIKLPDQFDQYVSSLRHKTRQMVRQSLRKYEGVGSFDVVTQANEIEEFLLIAASINRKTYQWHLGLKVHNNQSTRDEYQRLAGLGILRCYVLRINGAPCAFIRGTLVDGVFLYQTAGFLPEYSRWSPGKVALMLALKNLVEVDKCRLFDFGDVGDHVGYKSKFGNVFLTSRTVLISKRLSIRPALVASAQSLLLNSKNLTKRIFRKGPSRQKVRRLLRT
jgi:CelD/BcsL family acetyltransferase involved in cellulose biosynthesis